MLRYEVASPTLVATSQTKIADTVKTCLLQPKYAKFLKKILYSLVGTFVLRFIALVGAFLKMKNFNFWR